MSTYLATQVAENAGTIWTFTGEDTEGRRVAFAVEHREAAVIAGRLAATPDGVLVQVEPWQLLDR